MTNGERYCTVYAVPTNQTVVVKKLEKNNFSSEVKARRKYLRENTFILYRDENGVPSCRVEAKKIIDEN